MTKIDTKFEFLRVVVFYSYVSLNLELKNTIQWKNPFQNAKKKLFLWKKIKKSSNILLNRAQ